MNRLLLLLLLLLPVHAYGQVAAPQSVSNGQAILFELDDDQEGLQAIYTLLNPFDEDVTVTEIRPKGSNSLVLDPPCGWAGKIRVQVILVDAERRIVSIETVTVVVEAGNGPNPPPVDPKDDETDPKPPEPQPKPDYNGPNAMGVGKIAYDFPIENDAYLDSFATLIGETADMLKGYGGLKLLKANGPLAGTDREFYVYLQKQVKNFPKEYQDLYSACESYRMQQGIVVGSPVNMHWEFWHEVKSGIRAKKMQ